MTWRSNLMRAVKPPILTKAEAEFLAEKRAQGVPDSSIAIQLGRTVGELRRGAVLDDEPVGPVGGRYNVGKSQ